MSVRSLPVAVTGANGYVGSWLVQRLIDEGVSVREVVRGPDTLDSCGDAQSRVAVGDIGPDTDWTDALEGQRVVVHTAGVAHRRFADANQAQDIFDRVNRDGVIALFEQAKMAGVRHFIFVSTVGVYGSAGSHRPVTENARCEPIEPYAIAKLAAERALLQARDGIRLSIVRPPMVYGPNCPGNLSRLSRMVRSGVPLPFGRTPATRDLVSIQNLVDGLTTLIASERDESGIWNITDETSVTLPQIIDFLCQGLGCRNRIFDVPPGIISAIACFGGSEGALAKLIRSGRIDGSAFRHAFSWTPPCSPQEMLIDAGASFRHTRIDGSSRSSKEP